MEKNNTCKMSSKNTSENLKLIGKIVLDLDETLISFDGGYSKLLNDLSFLNISDFIISNVIENINNKEFSINLFIKKIEKINKKSFNKQTKRKIKKIFNQWLFNSIYIYNDAKRFIEIWEDRIPIIILTFGNPEYQQKKIRISGLDRFQSCYVTKPFSKIEKLNLILNNQYIVYVDDNINEINEISKNNTTCRIIPFWLKRNSELKYNKKSNDYSNISSLLDINKYISIYKGKLYIKQSKTFTSFQDIDLHKNVYAIPNPKN